MTQLALGWVLAFTDAAADETSGSILTLLLPLILLGGVFYFFMIMPQRRRMKAMTVMRERLSVGDEVRTIGGIRGVIQSMDDDEVVLDVGDGTSLRLVLRAIAEQLGGDE